LTVGTDYPQECPAPKYWVPLMAQWSMDHWTGQRPTQNQTARKKRWSYLYKLWSPSRTLQNQLWGKKLAQNLWGFFSYGVINCKTYAIDILYILQV
jgi:hypothetical protein